MSYAPDYGLRMLRDGYSSAMDLFFYDFRLYDLAVLGRGQYSTMVNMPIAGEQHALSLDFTHAQLPQVLAKAEPRLASFLRAELARDSVSPRAIDFEGYVAFGVRARLGALQTVANEQFVPLVAQEIF